MRGTVSGTSPTTRLLIKESILPFSLKANCGSWREEIRAWDAFEHLRYPIHSMNEAWRVLVPGGKLDLIVPTTDGRGAWQDPGHVSYWNPNSLWYFCEDHPCWQRFHAAYGIAARFRLVESTHAIDGPASNMIWKLRAILEAIK